MRMGPSLQTLHDQTNQPISEGAMFIIPGGQVTLHRETAKPRLCIGPSSSIVSTGGPYWFSYTASRRASTSTSQHDQPSINGEYAFRARTEALQKAWQESCQGLELRLKNILWIIPNPKSSCFRKRDRIRQG